MGKRKKSGRPAKLRAPDVRKKLLAYIAKTGNLQSACALVGIGYQTMLNECNRDSEFAEQVEQAKLLRLANLELASERLAIDRLDGPHIRWLLVHCDSERYAIKPETQTHVQTHVHVIANPDAIQSQLAALATELGIENVVDAVRIEKANGHHKANGDGSGEGPAGP